MADPFKIVGLRPVVVANSGGKTSGYNLWLHLEANGGALPDAARCVFTNTGWEHPATLAFLCEQERRWGVEIVCLEFCWKPATPAELDRLDAKAKAAAERLKRFRREPASFFAPKRKTVEVGVLFDNSPTATQLKVDALQRAATYASDTAHSLAKAKLVGVPSYRRLRVSEADTTGRPFTDLLEGLYRFRVEVKGEPPILPNGTDRLCTGHLKMRTSARFARDTWGVGPSGYDCRLGLRADEQERIMSAFATKSREAGVPVFPLDDAGIEKADVAKFWAAQPFGLKLKSHEGNCGGCYMKRKEALVDLVRRKFFPLDWWHEWEQRTGQRFRLERSYRGLEVMARTELTLLPPDDYDTGITCEGGYCSD